MNVLMSPARTEVSVKIRLMDSSVIVPLDLVEHSVKLVCIRITMSTEKAPSILLVWEVSIHSKLAYV